MSDEEVDKRAKQLAEHAKDFISKAYTFLSKELNVDVLDPREFAVFNAVSVTGLVLAGFQMIRDALNDDMAQKWISSVFKDIQDGMSLYNVDASISIALRFKGKGERQ